MKNYLSSSLLAVLAAVSGCANVERSRDLNNRDVPPSVTAMQVCSICHGIDGNSVSPNFPTLAAQQPAYIISQLENFRRQNRSDPAGFEYMWGLSHRLTDDQIKGLADYFSKQTPKAIAVADTTLMLAGKEIYENGLPTKDAPPCMACHGPQAEGAAAFPRLASQHQDYIVKQLQVFQRTDERPNTPMTQIAHLLSPEEIQAVAAYVQTFPKPQ